MKARTKDLKTSASSYGMNSPSRPPPPVIYFWKNSWRNPKSMQGNSRDQGMQWRDLEGSRTVALLRALSPAGRRKKKSKNLSNSIKSSCVKTSTLNRRAEDSCAHSFQESVPTQQNATTNTDKIKFSSFLTMTYTSSLMAKANLKSWQDRAKLI